MKLKLGQVVALAIAVVFAALLIFEAPFEAAAADTPSSQVVYAPVYDPPVIGNARGKVDLPILLLELGFVAFVAGAIFVATSQKKD